MSGTTMGESSGRFFMRMVNRGTPERVTAEAAEWEVNNAKALRRVQEQRASWGAGIRPRVEVFASAYTPNVRIDYHDGRGVVELRPATAEESRMVVKPEGELYAPGDRVIVRGTWYEYRTGTHHVLPEYEGVVVNWYGGRYNVRAVEPDEHGGDGVRECRVRELRPVDGVDVEAALKTSGLNIGDRVHYRGRLVEFPNGPHHTAPGRGRLTDVWVSQGEVVARVELEEPYRSVLGGVNDAPPLSTLHLVTDPPMTVENARRLAINLVVEERARAVLEAAGFVEGDGGFILRTDARSGVRLRLTGLDGDEWMTPRGDLWRRLVRQDWRVGLSSDSTGPYLVLQAPSRDLTAVIAEGKRREVETAYGEALAENAERNGDTEGCDPWNVQEPGVVAALGVLRKAGVRIAVIPGKPQQYRERYSELGPQGAYVMRGCGRTLEIEWLIDGACDEGGMRSRDTKTVRPVRNAALDEIADAFKAAGWAVWHVGSRNTATRRALKVAVTPQDDA
ncbi:hypothetical protein ACWDXD_24890 [Streptomyces sp. NPDC003314]